MKKIGKVFKTENAIERLFNCNRAVNSQVAILNKFSDEDVNDFVETIFENVSAILEDNGVNGIRESNNTLTVTVNENIEEVFKNVQSAISDFKLSPGGKDIDGSLHTKTLVGATKLGNTIIVSRKR